MCIVHGGPLEVIFAIDVAPSMYDEIPAMKDVVINHIQRLFIDFAQIRIGIMVFNDYEDIPNRLLQRMDFSTDVERLTDFVRNARHARVYHNFPEFYELLLYELRRSYSWTPGHRKCVVIIGDSEPDDYLEVKKSEWVLRWKKEARAMWRKLGATICSVKALDDYLDGFWRTIARVSDGFYIPFYKVNEQLFDYIASLYKLGAGTPEPTKRRTHKSAVHRVQQDFRDPHLKLRSKWSVWEVLAKPMTEAKDPPEGWRRFGHGAILSKVNAVVSEGRVLIELGVQRPGEATPTVLFARIVQLRPGDNLARILLRRSGALRWHMDRSLMRGQSLLFRTVALARAPSVRLQRLALSRTTSYAWNSGRTVPERGGRRGSLLAAKPPRQRQMDLFRRRFEALTKARAKKKR